MIAKKSIVAFIFAVVVASCIDPYIPDFKNYKSLLIVEGLITNENISNRIKLSRTFSNSNSFPEKVTDASVYITDGNGIQTNLWNCKNGDYKTDSTLFTGVIGQKYTLHITTNDGKEYTSDECKMLPVAAIDKIYYAKSDEISGIHGELSTGIKIFLNCSEAMNQYFRWSFEEVWKFIVPGAQRYNYIYINDTTFSFIDLPEVKEVCWKRNLSGNIITNSGANFINQEIQFIDPLKSDRLTKEYSILVKQYAISSQEHEFWDNLKKVGESGSDIFASQPYSVKSNIHCVNNTTEMVLGYFSVSAMSQERLFITAHELDPMYLPHYTSDCNLIRKSPDDSSVGPQPTWNEIYHFFVDVGNYNFVMPELSNTAIAGSHVSIHDLQKLVFSTKVCSICEYTGFSKKPDFWIDLK